MSHEIHRILVATDLSPVSEAALERASYLAKALGATSDAVFVWSYKGVFADAMVGSGPPEEAVERRRIEVEEEVGAYMEAQRACGLPVHLTLLRHGEPEEEIVNAAELGNYDLLVVGTNGREGVERFFLGSVAEQVVRRAPCPVLTVRPQS